MEVTFINNIGFVLLAIYLILVGVNSIVPRFTIPPLVTGIIALIAGVFILMGK